MTSAVVTSDTSSVLDAKPSHGRQKRRRNASQMPSAASAALNVTQKPHTNTGICGYRMSLYVGVISSSVTANRRTRATSHSPSTPAAASAGSGRCQNSSTLLEPFLFICESLFVWCRLSLSARPLSICTDGHCPRTATCAVAMLQCRDCLRYVACSCGQRVSIFQTAGRDGLRTGRHKRAAAARSGPSVNRIFSRAKAAHAARAARASVFSARCVGAATHVTATMSRLCPCASWLGTRRIASATGHCCASRPLPCRNSIATTVGRRHVAAATATRAEEELRLRSSVSCLPYTGGV